MPPPPGPALLPSSRTWRASRYAGREPRSGLKFLVVVVAVVAYVLDAMNQIVEMRHFMQERGGQLEDSSVKVLSAKIDFPVFLTAGVPDFIDTAPTVSPTPSVRGYGDRRASQFIVIKMLVEQVEHFLGFPYDFRYLQHDRVLLKRYVLFSVSERFENAMEHFGNAVETVVEGAATVVDKSMDFMWGFRPVRLVGRTFTFFNRCGVYGSSVPLEEKGYHKAAKACLIGGVLLLRHRL